MLDVFLSTPYDFYRPIDLLCDRDGLGHAIYVKPAAKTATNQMIVDLNFFRGQSGNLGSGGLSPADHLISDPNLAAIRAYVSHAVHRFHCGMRQKRNFVNSLHLVGGFR